MTNQDIIETESLEKRTNCEWNKLNLISDVSSGVTTLIENSVPNSDLTGNEIPDILSPPMRTAHQVLFGESNQMKLDDESVHLTITSPPYPMIAMWDFIVPMDEDHPQETFEKWHLLLDGVWKEVWRVTKEGGFICINIGDATRTINKKFSIFPNHVRITNAFMKLGASVLPSIIWQKPTNAPNKFMGSGMLPSGAYVTLEHEHILIFRKGDKRPFTSEKSKLDRRKSAFFWEERNIWFSDAWDLKGTSQKVKNADRERSAAFPFEIPFRLINMYSLLGDTVLDPFAGTGTTTLASIALGRNSIGHEIDPSFKAPILQKIRENDEIIKLTNYRRIDRHCAFIEEWKRKGKETKYVSKRYIWPVITSQEIDMCLPFPDKVDIDENSMTIETLYRLTKP